MCNCNSFRENCVTHSRTDACTHTHGANYNLPQACRAGDNKKFATTLGGAFLANLQNYVTMSGY